MTSAKVDGSVEFAGAELKGPIFLTNSDVGRLLLRGYVRNNPIIDLIHCSVAGIYGENTLVRGDVWFSKVNVQGSQKDFHNSVVLKNSTIKGSVLFFRETFIAGVLDTYNNDQSQYNKSSRKINPSYLPESSREPNNVRSNISRLLDMKGSVIYGDIDLTNLSVGTVYDWSEKCGLMDLSSTQINGRIYGKARDNGPILCHKLLLNAQVIGDVNIVGFKVRRPIANDRTIAIDAAGIDIKGEFILAEDGKKTILNGMVSFREAKAKGIQITGSSFLDENRQPPLMLQGLNARDLSVLRNWVFGFQCALLGLFGVFVVSISNFGENSFGNFGVFLVGCYLLWCLVRIDKSLSPHMDHIDHDNRAEQTRKIRRQVAFKKFVDWGFNGLTDEEQQSVPKGPDIDLKRANVGCINIIREPDDRYPVMDITGC